MNSTGALAMKTGSVGLLLIALVCVPRLVVAQNFVPGTGQRLAKVGDDFEDAKWAYNYNLPKSSDENDKQQRVPGGESVNGRWYEGVMRGQPDLIKRVATPEGGIASSQGSLLMRSKQTGVPGSYSGKNQQDDLIVNVSGRLGGPVPISRSPSVVVRVFLPPWEEWEQRTGNSFGFRTACEAYKTQKKRWGSSGTKLETFWPGMFIHFNKADAKNPENSATLILRAGPQGNDFFGPKIKETGWWTLGMSFSSDGQVHYYAHPGVENLTAKDHISSQVPYSLRGERLDAFFFNVVNADNGTWSTSWIIDDPALYVLR
jgi:hypothetical protein